MLDPKWDVIRLPFTEILDDLEKNRDQWRNAAAQNDLPLECHVAECMAKKVSELSHALPIPLTTGEIADAIEGLLWDFLQYRQLYSARASTSGLPLNEYLFEALVDAIVGYVDFLKEWDAESARLASRAKSRWLFCFFGPFLRFWHTPMLNLKRLKKKSTDDSDPPF